MSQKFLLRSFAGGEITPELAGRLDLVKYQTGLQLCRNFITLPHGPAVRRPGTEYIAQVKDSTRKVRLIPFTFSASQTAVIEMGHQYLRVHINGGALLEANKTLTGISSGVWSVTAHGYSDGDWVYCNGHFFEVWVNDADSFFVDDIQYVGVNHAPTTFPTNIARVFTLATPYQEADLFDIHYAQSADIVTLTHPSYATRELSRLSEVTWSLTEVNFAPSANAPTGVTVTPTVAVNEHLTSTKYRVTAVADDGVTETLPSLAASASNNLTLAGNYNTITWNAVDGYSRYNVYKLRGGVYGYIGQVTPNAGTSKDVVTATPYNDIGFFKYGRVRVVTSTAHGFSTGNSVYMDGTGYFDGLFVITVESSTTFTYAKKTQFSFEVTTGKAYTPSLSLVDDNVQADTTQSPPEDIISLNKGVGDYPSTTVYHEQRRWFAGTDGKPQVLWATRTGATNNLTSSIPSRDADGMELRVASSQYNQIRHLVALTDLIALTAGGEFRIFADGAPAITPTSVSVKPQGYSGASNVQPVVTSGTVMYVQAQGSRIRELSYSWEASAYKTTDATIMAPHRFNYHTIVDMAYTRSPDQILWAVREDGLLLGMTYVPDQQVYGWHAHDTDGKFESVTVVPEGNEDMLYTVVQREVDGRNVRYIERLSTRYFSKLAYANYVDSGRAYATETEVDVLVQAPSEMVTMLQTMEEKVAAIRKIGNEVWVFGFRAVDYTDMVFTQHEEVLTAWVYAASDYTFQRQVNLDHTMTGHFGENIGVQVYVFGEEVYIFGSANWHMYPTSWGPPHVIKFSASDPSNFTRTVIDYGTSAPYNAYLADYATLSNDGTGTWAPTSSDEYTFYLRNLTTGVIEDVRSCHRTNLYTAMSPFGLVHLPNGDLVIGYSSPTYPANSAHDQIVFMHPNHTNTIIDLGYRFGWLGAAKYIGNDTLYMMSSAGLLKINTATKTVVRTWSAAETKPNVWTESFSYGSSAQFAYDPDTKVLAWQSFDYNGYYYSPPKVPMTPSIRLFNTETETFIGSRELPNPGGIYVDANTNPGDDFDWDIDGDMRWIDGHLWVGAYRVGATDNDFYGYQVYALDAGNLTSTAVVGSTTGLSKGDTLYVPPGGYDAVYGTGSGLDAGAYNFTILEVISPTMLLLKADGLAPDSLYNVNLSASTIKKVTTISGLDHLEGKTVQILADGAVHPERVVAGGAVTLDYPAGIVMIGLGYTSDLKTLPLAMEGAAAAGQGTIKNINKAHLRVTRSSMVKAGPAFDRLREYPARSVGDNYGEAPALRDGEISMTVDPSWSTDAALCVRQDLPLPLTVTSMTLEVQNGG